MENYLRWLNVPLRLLAAASLTAALLLLSGPPPVAACTGLGPGLPSERFLPSNPAEEAGLASDSIALLGSVIEEMPIERTMGWAYLSNVRVVVPL